METVVTTGTIAVLAAILIFSMPMGVKREVDTAIPSGIVIGHISGDFLILGEALRAALVNRPFRFFYLF